MRIIAYIALLYVSIHVSPLLVLPLVLVYLCLWSGYELLVGAFLIDAYFGVTAPWPVYTLGVTVVMVLIEWLRPRLAFYTT